MMTTAVITHVVMRIAMLTVVGSLHRGSRWEHPVLMQELAAIVAAD